MFFDFSVGFPEELVFVPFRLFFKYPSLPVKKKKIWVNTKTKFLLSLRTVFDNAGKADLSKGFWDPKKKITGNQQLLEMITQQCFEKS